MRVGTDVGMDVGVGVGVAVGPDDGSEVGKAVGPNRTSQSISLGTRNMKTAYMKLEYSLALSSGSMLEF